MINLTDEQKLQALEMIKDFPDDGSDWDGIHSESMLKIIKYHQIVQRLKEKIKEIYDNYPHDAMKENGGIERTNSDYIILKSILENKN